MSSAIAVSVARPDRTPSACGLRPSADDDDTAASMTHTIRDDDSSDSIH